jgi:hypothetical protein
MIQEQYEALMDRVIKLELNALEKEPKPRKESKEAVRERVRRHRANKKDSTPSPDLSNRLDLLENKVKMSNKSLTDLLESLKDRLKQVEDIVYNA